MRLDGEIELGNKGYLISVYEGKAEVKVGGLKIQIDDVKKLMVYVDAEIALNVSDKGQLCIKSKI